jgi:hypothetical protein
VHGSCTAYAHEDHEIFDRALVRADRRGERSNRAGRWRTRRRADDARHDLANANANANAIADAGAIADGPVHTIADAEPAAGLAVDAIVSNLAERAVDAERTERAIAIAR